MNDAVPDHLRDPAAIYAASFAAIAGAPEIARIPQPLQALAGRVAHAAGDAAVLTDLAWSDTDAASRGRAALEAGAPVLTDARMVADGIIRRRLPAGNRVVCTLGLGTVAGAARRAGTTRSAAAVDLWRPWLGGAVVAIGNAPTALFRLVEGLAQGWPAPALIVAMPVGYVGAAESKDALIAASPAPWIALRGRRGGSAVAAAAVNALVGDPDDGRAR